jgi:nucleotide-binding universal stress UspA family protein
VETESFRRILVVIDEEARDRPVLARAVELAQGCGGCLTVMAVVPRPARNFSGFMCVPLPKPEELEEATWKLLDRATKDIGPEVAVATMVSRGPRSRAILERIAACEPDVVVVRSSRVARALFRARLAKCSVPIIWVSATDEPATPSSVPARAPSRPRRA